MTAPDRDPVRFVATLANGSKYRNGYVIVYGEDEEDCRRQMKFNYASSWAFMYPNEEAAGVEKYGLHLVATIGPRGHLDDPA